MPYAFSINEGAEEIVNYLKLGGADYDYPCMDWYLIPKLENELLERTLLRHGRRKYNYEYIRATSSQPTRRGICHIYGQYFLSRFTDMVNKLKPYQSSYTFLLSRTVVSSPTPTGKR